MVVRELLTRWGFEVDTQPIERMESLLKVTAAGVAAVGAAGIAAAGTLFGLAKSVADAADAADEAAQRTGIAAESFQALTFAAKIGGAGAEDLEVGLKKLSMGMVDAKDGNKEMVKAFKTLGVSATNANGTLRPTESVLLDLSDAFQKLPQGAKKSDLAVKLFGRSGTALLPMLNEGSKGLQDIGAKAAASGAIFGKSARELGDKFDRSMGMLDVTLLGVRNTIGVKLIPIVIDIVNKVQAWVAQNRDLLNQRLDQAVSLLAATAQFAWQAFTLLVAVFKEIVIAGRDVFDLVGGMNTVLPIAISALAAFGGIQIVQGILAVRSAIQALSAAMLANPWMVLLAAAIFIITQLVQHWDEFKDFWRMTVLFLSEAWITFRDTVIGVVGEMFGVLTDWGNSILDFFAGIWQGILDGIFGVVDKIKGAVSTVGGFLGLGGGDTAGGAGAGLVGGTAGSPVQQGSRNVDVQSNIVVNLPSGTNASTAADVQSGVRRVVREEMDRATRGALSDVPG